LIAAGANVKARDKDGKTALMLAVQFNHDDVVRALKQAGETE
jgi:ankyrin repeat protein